jgi:hypothetical protein
MVVDAIGLQSALSNGIRQIIIRVTFKTSTTTNTDELVHRVWWSQFRKASGSAHEHRQPPRRKGLLVSFPASSPQGGGGERGQIAGLRLERLVSSSMQ